MFCRCRNPTGKKGHPWVTSVSVDISCRSVVSVNFMAVIWANADVDSHDFHLGFRVGIASCRYQIILQRTVCVRCQRAVPRVASVTASNCVLFFT